MESFRNTIYAFRQFITMLVLIPGAVLLFMILVVDSSVLQQMGTYGLILTGWAVIPPLWFWFDYYCLPDEVKADPVKLTDIQYIQGLSRHYWLAVLAVLIALYLRAGWQ